MCRIAVIGSQVVDMAMRTPRLPRRGDNIQALDFRVGAGGKGGNAAAAITRLGGEALAIGCVGDDQLGRFQIEALLAQGVDISGIIVLPGTGTAVAFVLVEQDGQNAVLLANRTNELLTGHMVAATLAPHWGSLDALLVNFECCSQDRHRPRPAPPGTNLCRSRPCPDLRRRDLGPSHSANAE